MREWHKLPPLARTWDTFKDTLLEEQKNEREKGVAHANAYAHSANTNTATDALNNLAAATAADRQAAANKAEAVANLTVSNQNLAQQLQQAQQQLQHMMTNLNNPATVPGGGYRAPPPLVAPIDPHILAQQTPGATDRTRGNQPPCATRRWNNENYCSSCGYDITEWQTSKTCPPSRRAPDHNELATRTSTLGGSERHRALVGR